MICVGRILRDAPFFMAVHLEFGIFRAAGTDRMAEMYDSEKMGNRYRRHGRREEKALLDFFLVS